MNPSRSLLTHLSKCIYRWATDMCFPLSHFNMHIVDYININFCIFCLRYKFIYNKIEKLKCTICWVQKSIHLCIHPDAGQGYLLDSFKFLSCSHPTQEIIIPITFQRRLVMPVIEHRLYFLKCTWNIFLLAEMFSDSSMLLHVCMHCFGEDYIL